MEIKYEKLPILANPANFFKKGNSGRPAGSMNKVTKTVKETVLAVFNELQEHPTASLRAWAENKPGDFYQIAAKLIPTEISARLNKIQLEIVYHDKLSEQDPITPELPSSESTEGL